MTDLVDVAIVGAGAAGISAARRLTSRGRSVLLIEALPRLGGRGHTIDFEGMPLDLGCGWFHSAERNPLRQLADDLCLKVDRSESAWGHQLGARGFSASDQKAAWQAYQRFCSRLREHPPASDRASDALDAGEHWAAFIDSLSTFIDGTELHQLSALDFAAYDDAASETNWRLPTVYGAFIASLGHDLPIALNTTVLLLIAGSIRQGEGMHPEIRSRFIARGDGMGIEPSALPRRFRMGAEERPDLVLVLGRHCLQQLQKVLWAQ